ncbi:MAG TPA: hypothetical protein VKB25_06545 [Conexibacter sp.]|nr:hypothetical protein [Conexibacter sp.]
MAAPPPPDEPAAPPPPLAGLCNACVHQQLVPNRRGSVFSLCRRSKTDAAFPRYPRLPVRECRGFEPRGGAAPHRAVSRPT